jgi:hypothetical protein
MRELHEGEQADRQATRGHGRWAGGGGREEGCLIEEPRTP